MLRGVIRMRSVRWVNRSFAVRESRGSWFRLENVSPKSLDVSMSFDAVLTLLGRGECGSDGSCDCSAAGGALIHRLPVMRH